MKEKGGIELCGRSPLRFSCCFPTWAACFDLQDEGDQSASTTLDIANGSRAFEMHWCLFVVGVSHFGYNFSGYP